MRKLLYILMAQTGLDIAIQAPCSVDTLIEMGAEITPQQRNFLAGMCEMDKEKRRQIDAEIERQRAEEQKWCKKWRCK